jgi:hypothetical protein
MANLFSKSIFHALPYALTWMALAAACSSSNGASTSTGNTSEPNPVSANVGSAGGVIVTGDGVANVNIPAGAVGANTMITITPSTSSVPGAVGQVWEIGPTGTQFSVPITITLAYKDSDLGGMPPTAFAVSTVVNGAWQPIPATVVNPAAHIISGQTTHLSPYAISPLSASSVVDAGADATLGSGGALPAADGGSSAGNGGGTSQLDGSPTGSDDGGMSQTSGSPGGRDGGASGAPGNGGSGSSQPLETLNVTFASSGTDASTPTYSFSCPGYLGAAMGGGTNAADGPNLQTPNAMNNSPCWPAANPNIALFVGYSGFLPSNGPPVGSIDLSTSSGSPCVWLQVESSQQVAVGKNAPFRNYSSASGCGPGYIGSGALGATGTLTLTSLGAYDAGASGQGAGSGGPSAGGGPMQVYLLQLTNVTLPSSQDESNGLYPPQVNISATGYWLYTPM